MIKEITLRQGLSATRSFQDDTGLLEAEEREYPFFGSVQVGKNFVRPFEESLERFGRRTNEGHSEAPPCPPFDGHKLPLAPHVEPSSEAGVCGAVERELKA